MLYELRTYSAMPGRLPDLNKRFAEITLGFFKKHGIQMVGFWTNELGGSSDQLLYILAYESLADREKKWAGFMSDSERLAKFAETEKNGPLVRRLTRLVRQADPARVKLLVSLMEAMEPPVRSDRPRRGRRSGG